MSVLALRTGGWLLAISLFCGSAYAGWQDLLKDAGNILQNTTTQSGGSSLSNAQIDAGLKQALSIGAERAVALLGVKNGFLLDKRVRIPVPGNLAALAKGLRAMGQGQYVDEFEETVNRAAERAVPETLAIVKKTVQGMSLGDVQRILKGGDSAATDFLRKRAGSSLHQAVRPLVANATQKAGVTSAYKQLVGQTQNSLGGLGRLLDTQSLDLDEYVTEKTLDGLFIKLAAEEKAIRENPVARTTELLKRVFAD